MPLVLKIRIPGLFTFLFFPSAFVIAQSTPFSLQSVQPNAALAGSSATTVTLKGDGFTSSVIVRISNAAVFGTEGAADLRRRRRHFRLHLAQGLARGIHPCEGDFRETLAERITRESIGELGVLRI